MNKQEMHKYWNKEAGSLLIGRTIIRAQYMNDAWAQKLEFEEHMGRPLMLQLDDGTIVIPMSDDEGNSGGAIQYFGKERADVLPLLP